MKILNAKHARFRCLVALALLSAMPALLADKLVAGASQSFESGDYGGATTTDINTTSLKLAYFGEVWSASIRIPYVTVSGIDSIIPGTRGNVRGNGAGATTTTSTLTRVTRSGIGDTQLTLARAFLPEMDDDLFVEWTLGVKLATADEAQLLGSGENDYSIKWYADRQFGDWLPGVSIGYQFTGDTPQTDYNDIVFASIGAAYRLGQHSSLGFSYDFEQASSDGVDDFAALGIDFSSDISRNSRFGVGLQRGMTDSSPASGLNLFVNLSF